MEKKLQDGKVTYYRSFEGSLNLAFREWRPQKPSKKIFLYIHGIESHSSWFANIATLLIQRGYAVYAPDRRGSGKSEGVRGHLESYMDTLRDIKVFYNSLKNGRPEVEIYCIGMSLGASIAVNYSLYYPDDFRGLVLLSPAIETKIDLPLKTKALVFLSSLLAAEKLFPIPIDINMFAKNRDIIDFIESDPLRVQKVTAKFYLELLKMKINHLRKVRKIKSPLITFMAEKDPIIDNDAVIRWMNKLQVPFKYSIIKGAGHSLQLEKGGVESEMINSIVNWVEGAQ
jgi:alpha-beta hydrolase superfamily lysophospholipase